MMKKIILFALLGLLAISCSDDDPTVFEQDVVGVWTLIEENSTHKIPVGTPKYIRFDGSNYYSSSSDTETNPTSNQKAYQIEFKQDINEPIDIKDVSKGYKSFYFINISGDKEYRIIKPVDNNLLDLSYVLEPFVPGDEVNEKQPIPAKRQSLPYMRVTAEASNPTPSE